MNTPRLGYLCLCENPTAEAGRALIRQFVLVREADRMGYDDIWIGEQHHDSAWPCGAASALLGHLSAVTSKARIGSMALLPALRDVARLAEDIATVDLLSKGRLDFGVASGAAFPQTLQAAGLDAATARRLLREHVDQLHRLLDGQSIPGSEPPQPLVPRPAQAAVPVWVAADDEGTLRWAAERGYGLMAAATHRLERVERMRRIYRETSGGRDPALVLARFGCSAESADAADAIAMPYFEALAQKSQAYGWGSDAATSAARDPQTLRAESLIGSHAEVAALLRTLGDRWGATHVAVVPTCAQFDTHKHILADFVDEVRPLLDD